MINALKSINKGLLTVIIAVICIPIFIILFLAIIQSCGKTISHEKYEKKMIDASIKYVKAKNLSVNKAVEISLDDLVSEKYLKSPEKALGDATCSGKVIVRRNGKNEEKENKGELNYVSDLVCTDYKSNTLLNSVMGHLTTVDSGLYQDGDYYIYKGDKVKNYINFYGKKYRIMSVDNNGIVKLIRTNEDNLTKIWDNKYNSEIGYSYGKNTYKDSMLFNSILNEYNNNKKISVEARKHIVSYDICIGKRNSKDYSISRELDCSEKLENQLVSLINLSDFAMASLDPECNSINTRSCKNYNYLKNIIISSWTLNAVTDNSYEIFTLDNGLPNVQVAKQYNSYNFIIYIDGNEKINSGKGTLDDPFVIE